MDLERIVCLQDPTQVVVCEAQGDLDHIWDCGIDIYRSLSTPTRFCKSSKLNETYLLGGRGCLRDLEDLSGSKDVAGCLSGCDEKGVNSRSACG